jgi:hypothetical protein
MNPGLAFPTHASQLTHLSHHVHVKTISIIAPVTFDLVFTGLPGDRLVCCHGAITIGRCKQSMANLPR